MTAVNRALREFIACRDQERRVDRIGKPDCGACDERLKHFRQ